MKAEYKPLVSIALTTYNGGKLIIEQIDSILKQTYQNFELVISDDGSNKETIDILNTYTQKNKKIKWYRSKLQRGYVKNTQNAISLCKGKIIFLCDQDDIWYAEKIEKHVECYRDETIKWVYNRLIITDAISNPIGKIEDTMPDYYRQKNMLENIWGSCIGGAMTSYRSEIIKKAMPIPDYAPAHDSWIQLIIYPAKPFFVNQVLQTYRQHENNQIGLKFKTKGEIMKLETQAIKDNYHRLKSLSLESRLSISKRIYFTTIYILKKLREFYRSTFSRA